MEEAKALAERGDYRGLAQLCLKILGVSSWHEAWARGAQLAERSKEYVILKFLASAYVLSSDEIYNVLNEAEREFLARDLAVCIGKVSQLLGLG